MKRNFGSTFLAVVRVRFWSNFLIVGAFVSKELVVRLWLLGVATFDGWNVLLSVVGVGVLVSALLSTFVCAPVTNSRYGGVGGYFQAAQWCHPLWYIHTSVRSNEVQSAPWGVGWYYRQCSSNLRWGPVVLVLVCSSSCFYFYRSSLPCLSQVHNMAPHIYADAAFDSVLHNVDDVGRDAYNLIRPQSTAAKFLVTVGS